MYIYIYIAVLWFYLGLLSKCWISFNVMDAWHVFVLWRMLTQSQAYSVLFATVTTFSFCHSVKQGWSLRDGFFINCSLSTVFLVGLLFNENIPPASFYHAISVPSWKRHHKHIGSWLYDPESPAAKLQRQMAQQAVAVLKIHYPDLSVFLMLLPKTCVLCRHWQGLMPPSMKDLWLKRYKLLQSWVTRRANTNGGLPMPVRKFAFNQTWQSIPKTFN